MNTKNNVLVILVLTALFWQVNSHRFEEFQDFVKKFDKIYDESEFMNRLNIFSQNFDLIHKHNHASNSTSFQLGIGPFADLTTDEFQTMHLSSLYQPNTQTKSCNGKINELPTVPTSMDWRDMNAVTPVKNQGNCGSCWAFSTTGAIEGWGAINTGKLISLSEQELVDCSQDYGNKGCFGGLMPEAFEFVIDKNGLCNEDSYPYSASQDSCLKCDPVNSSKITDCTLVPEGSQTLLIQALSQQPVSVAIQANTFQFQHYKSGVFDVDSCYKGSLDHGVLLVGYDSESLIVKNSWGTSWGDNGYIKLARTDDNIGMCGVYLSASFPN
ncbi:Papain family cysteine protease [seawater metagenome]|uniref:Papain family cysteine protease n=1 Tax=seawater metagenome TaxID=1561972 RepID=A0A5E8CKY8_9ZZZZ